MDKEQLLAEIRRIAAENGGKPPGRLMFEKETGIGEHGWRGRYWARWNDAVREAGLEPNQKNTAYPDEFLIGTLAALTRELGHFPTESELRLKSRSDADFPNASVYRRLGKKSSLVAKVLEYCKRRNGYSDVIASCENVAGKIEPTASNENSAPELNGHVYLLKSGRFYKIGRSNAVGRRERELAIQLPEKAGVVHSIRTDDPTGIEAYWHKRFEAKRRNGEWFELAQEDIRAFKRRKFM